MNSSEEFHQAQQAVSTHLVALTRAAGQLANEDLDFLRASDKKAGKKVDRKNGKLLELAQQVIESSTVGTPLAAPSLKKPGQIEDNWSTIATIIDNLLERADRCLDEYTGVITRLTHDKEQKADASAGVKSKRDGRLPKSHPLEKPQLLFKRVPKNDDTAVFKPLLTSKPHAVVPFEESIQLSSEVSEESRRHEYFHPYENEITQYKYPEAVYSQSEPIPANDDPDGKTLTWVDTPEKVAEMLEELKVAKEIAVDLEHHDTHSFVGIVCLMQISTRKKDWIVDTLKPWREDLQALNAVFTDPQILKVFHGSTMDMIWLQRDLGLYVVGLFDTYHATNALQYPRHGLAYLLKHFENFDAQKQYQMADWRVRPLGKELIQYARSDTHFLLHIYDCIRNELVQHSTPTESLVDYVLEKSKMESLRKYERAVYDYELGLGPTGWLGLLLRTPSPFTKHQLAVFKAVHQFRDQVARRVDESLLTVMRNDTIFAVARATPEEMPELLGTAHPVSQFVQPKLSELLSVIKKAKADGENGPSLNETLQKPEVLSYREKNSFSRVKWGDRKKAQAREGAAAAPKLADIIRAEREKADEAPSVAAESTFWGTMGVQPDLNTAVCELRLTVPVPELAPESSPKNVSHATPVTSNVPKSSDMKDAKILGTDTPANESTTFSIKELRRTDLKRKAEDAVSSTNEAGVEEASGDNVVDESSQNKARKLSKAEKKQRKAEKKAKQQEELEAKQDAEAFDYSAAPSVLEGSAASTKTKKEKLFDPYAKALDTPKGLPRRSGGSAGRSKTFKS